MHISSSSRGDEEDFGHQVIMYREGERMSTELPSRLVIKPSNHGLAYSAKALQNTKISGLTVFSSRNCVVGMKCTASHPVK